VARIRRPVPSRIGLDGRRPPDAAELSGDALTVFTELLEKLRRHEDLSTDEAARAMGAIMDGQALPSQIAALLVALALNGERLNEVVGFSTAMGERGMALPSDVGPVFDTCGTGGDGVGTFNVSTAAALIVAGAGVRVAKHGNRSASSRCGSAD